MKTLHFHYSFCRARIEREDKDIRLEKLRVKAAEQRETVLQSIMLVVLSFPFIRFLNLPRFFPIILYYTAFSSSFSMFLFDIIIFHLLVSSLLIMNPVSSSLHQLSSWLINGVISAPFL